VGDCCSISVFDADSPIRMDVVNAYSSGPVNHQLIA